MVTQTHYADVTWPWCLPVGCDLHSPSLSWVGVDWQLASLQHCVQ